MEFLKDHIKGAVTSVVGTAGFLMKWYKGIIKAIENLEKKIDVVATTVTKYVDNTAKKLKEEIDGVDDRRQLDYLEMKIVATSVQTTLAAMEKNFSRVDDTLIKLTHIILNGNAAKLSTFDEIQELKNESNSKFDELKKLMISKL
jgi:predicted  nucleic acid-binding Zn-ribbon protein